jgi:hypothetical protein
MTEILIVYTRLNGISYVQGMNEVLGIIYFVMRNESDSFWVFSAVLNQLKELFMPDADSSNEGIYYRIDILNDMLRQYDYNLWKHFQGIDFPLATLGMRWLTTILVMDLNLPDSLRVWDFALQACRSNQLLSFSTCLSLSYLLCLSDFLLSKNHSEDSVEFCAHFGRSPDLSVDKLLISCLSIFAFENILRGRYSPTSEEPVIDALVDAVDSVKMRVAHVVASEEMRKTKDGIVDGVHRAKTALSGWFGSLVNGVTQSGSTSAAVDRM